jgi:hypothetical protein
MRDRSVIAAMAGASTAVAAFLSFLVAFSMSSEGRRHELLNSLPVYLLLPLVFGFPLALVVAGILVFALRPVLRGRSLRFALTTLLIAAGLSGAITLQILLTAVFFLSPISRQVLALGAAIGVAGAWATSGVLRLDWLETGSVPPS